MALWQGRSSRKVTGGKYRPIRKRKKHEIGGEVVLPVIGNHATKVVKSRGGNLKVRITTIGFCNVWVASKSKTVRTKVITEISNAANKNYVQRNIVNKGSIVKTDLGNVKITSRPGQDGCINGILLTE